MTRFAILAALMFAIAFITTGIAYAHPHEETACHNEHRQADDVPHPRPADCSKETE